MTASTNGDLQSHNSKSHSNTGDRRRMIAHPGSTADHSKTTQITRRFKSSLSPMQTNVGKIDGPQSANCKQRTVECGNDHTIL